MNRAVFYARVSSDLQHKERSIESQIAELKRQIEKSGSKLVKEYVDNGYSGALLDRPAMDQLRKDLRTNVFDTIYILNTDRIARDVTHQNIIVGEMLRYKKQIIINGKDYIHNPENKFTLTVLGAVSELERAKLIERTTRGRQHRLRQGILLGNGHQLYGYTYSKKTPTSWPSYAINEKEAKVVRYIFNTYAEGGVGIHTIATQLDRMGVEKRRGRNCLEYSGVEGILNNETYTGFRYFNTMKQTRVPSDPMSKAKQGKMERTPRSEWIGIPVPAIISKKIFEKVRKRLEHNHACWRNSRQPQLLSNLVWCGMCETRCYALRRSYQIERSNGTYRYRRIVYVCRSKSASGHIPEIAGHALETLTFDMIRETMLVPERLHECIDLLHKRANAGKLEQQLLHLEERIRVIAQQKKRIIDLYASGDLEHEEYIKRIRIYDTETTALKEKRDGPAKYAPLLQKPELIEAGISKYCQIVQTRFKQCADFETKRKFLQEYVSKVTYHRKNKATTKVKVCGSIPIQIGPETVGVEFTIEHNMDWHEMMARSPKQSEPSVGYDYVHPFSKITV